MIKFEITLKDIDYGDLSYHYLPKVLNQMSKKEKVSKLVRILGGMHNIMGTLAKAALAVLPQETKDEMVVKVFSGYKEEITSVVNGIIKEKNIKLQVTTIDLKKL